MSTVVSGGRSADPERTRVVKVPADTPVEDLRVLQAAQAEEQGSREEVRALLARKPEWIDRLGSLAADAEETLFESSREQTLVVEAWRADLGRVRSSLTGPGDGALERLLIDRAVLCWAAVTLAERKRQSRSSDVTADAEFWDRRVSRLHADFLRACRTLATVRRAGIPRVQVNIAEQQVNLSA